MQIKKILCTQLVLATLLSLLFCGCKPINTKKSVVVFDSDFGTDDAVAMLLAGERIV